MVAATVAALALMLPAPTVRAQRNVNARAEILTAFTKRLDSYVALKKKADDGVPAAAPSDSTAGVEARKKLLAARLREARNGAKPGDLVGDAAPILKEIILNDAKARGVRDAYAAMQEVPPQNPPAVNAAYPETRPLATVPPLILVNLPKLPDNLEYRFMGRDLILRDRDTNLIVDFVTGAVPAFDAPRTQAQPVGTASKPQTGKQ